MDEEQLRDFIRENLILEIEYPTMYSPGNDVKISLRLHGSSREFSSVNLHIPDKT